MVKSKFTPQEKARIVLEFFNTNIGPAEICRKHHVHPTTFYQWKDRFVDGGKASLNTTANNTVYKNLKRENDALKRIVGEITMANDALKKTLEGGKR